MKVNKVLAKDSQSALKIIRNNFPKDAVILSNKKNNTGVEFLIANEVYDVGTVKEDSEIKKVDYGVIEEVNLASPLSSVLSGLQEEISQLRSLLRLELPQLKWQLKKEKDPLESKIIERLLNLGFDYNIVEELLKDFQQHENLRETWINVKKGIIKKIKFQELDFNKDKKIIFIGPPGSGKTNLLLNVVSKYVLSCKEYSFKIFSCCNAKVGGNSTLDRVLKLLGLSFSKLEKIDICNSESFKNQIALIDAGEDLLEDGSLESRKILEDKSILKVLVLPAIISSEYSKLVLDKINRAQNIAIAGSFMDKNISMGRFISNIIKKESKLMFVLKGAGPTNSLAKASDFDFENTAFKRKANNMHNFKIAEQVFKSKK